MTSMRNGDKVAHWNWGEGEVIKANPTRDEVPKEWQHDWESVVMAQFWYLNNACVWVLEEDLDLMCNASRAVV